MAERSDNTLWAVVVEGKNSYALPGTFSCWRQGSLEKFMSTYTEKPWADPSTKALWRKMRRRDNLHATRVKVSWGDA